MNVERFTNIIFTHLQPTPLAQVGEEKPVLNYSEAELILYILTTLPSTILTTHRFEIKADLWIYIWTHRQWELESTWRVQTCTKTENSTHYLWNYK